MAVPSGLFIPGLVTGAAWGRLMAIGCKQIFHPNVSRLIYECIVQGGPKKWTIFKSA